MKDFHQKTEPATSLQSTEYKKVVLHRAGVDRQGAFHLADTLLGGGFLRDVRQSRHEMPSPDSGQLSDEQLPCTQSISLKSVTYFFPQNLSFPFVADQIAGVSEALLVSSELPATVRESATDMLG
jgi:hypothetical protein